MAVKVGSHPLVSAKVGIFMMLGIWSNFIAHNEITAWVRTGGVWSLFNKLVQNIGPTSTTWWELVKLLHNILQLVQFLALPSTTGKFTVSGQLLILYNGFENCILQITSTSSRGQWVNSLGPSENYIFKITWRSPMGQGVKRAFRCLLIVINIDG